MAPVRLTYQSSFKTAITGVTTIEPTTTISTKFIGSAVERTNRPMNKSAVLESLETLLSREVDAGNFMRVGEDPYSLPPLPPSTYQPPTSYPMPLAENQPISSQNAAMSHPNTIGSSTQNSMMSVPMTALAPSASVPMSSLQSPQLDLRNQVRRNSTKNENMIVYR